jgi:hypothetical protein
VSHSLNLALCTLHIAESSHSLKNISHVVININETSTSTTTTNNNRYNRKHDQHDPPRHHHHLPYARPAPPHSHHSAIQPLTRRSSPRGRLPRRRLRRRPAHQHPADLTGVRFLPSLSPPSPSVSFPFPSSPILSFPLSSCHVLSPPTLSPLSPH